MPTSITESHRKLDIMNIANRPRRKAIRFLGRMLSAGFLVFFAGITNAPPVVAGTVPTAPTIMLATASSVPVAQQPLTIRQPIPPNIVLMLDDSGSMAWDYMPDACYLSRGVTCDYGVVTAVDNKAIIDSSNNSLYYNPDYNYKPPVKADGSSYTNYTDMTNVPLDGFDLSKGTVVLTNYFSNDFRGKWLNTATSNIYYSTSGDSTATVTYTSTTPNSGQCNAQFNHIQNTVGVEPTYNETTHECTFDYHPAYFQYSTYAGGVYTLHFVAAGSVSCGTLTNCVLASTVGDGTNGAPEGVVVGQNIANWFAYYHTRILMAKTGLMSVFSDMNPDYRLGFGSIDGGDNINVGQNANGNYKNLPSDRYEYTDAYNGGNNYIAEVKPFGTGINSTDQKSLFWNWISKAIAAGGTPLRQSLDAVGKYYKTSQPWQSSTTDTTMLACRQSYVILTTDGFWNGGSPDVGNVDNKDGPVNTDPNAKTGGYVPRPPFSDSVSDTLADVAMKYWETDLRSDISNEVPVPSDGSDPAFWQHMVTFAIGMGFEPEGIQPAGTTYDQIRQWANGGAAISGFSWPEPSSDSINNIADMVHAGINGHGGFYSATDPQTFVKGLKDALDRATSRTGSGASLAANSTQLKTGTMAYQAVYHTKTWTGELKAYSVDPVTGKLADHPEWNAADTGTMPSAASRNIHSYNPESDTYLAFKNGGTATSPTPPALSTAQKTILGEGDVNDTTTQANMVDYLRGDDTVNTAWRQRDGKILGDIVDSQPVYAGTVNTNEFSGRTFTGMDTFFTWGQRINGTTVDPDTGVVTTTAPRPGRIYVAANDGMLHAFDADTGEETYAYLPGAVITHGSTTGGIAQLADPGYGGPDMPHQYFNDGQLTVADAYLPALPQDNGYSWHTILVGTTGRGAAKAVYALDVTDPDDIKFLWERSAWDGKTNSDYIGQMTGKPIIAQVADGKWAVLIGNGYNSANGTSALLQFSLADGTLSVHTTDSETANGLSAPAVWIKDRTTGISTVAYAGDLKGNVWSFSLNTNDSTGTKLFTAETKDTSGVIHPQPITSGMLVGKNPGNEENPDNQDLWVFFGTGRYLASEDITNTDVQSWYGLVVKASTGSKMKAVTSSATRADNLAERKIIAQFPGKSVPNSDGSTTTILPTRVVSLASDDSTVSLDGKSGWYIDLVSPIMSEDADGNLVSTGNYGAGGERMVTPNQFQGSRLVGTSIIPKSDDLCNPSGTGWIMAVDPFTGTNPETKFYDVNGDGIIDNSDKVKVNGALVPVAGVGFSSLPNAPIFVGGAMLTSFDNGTTSSVMTSGAGGSIKRVSWRELVNP